MGWDQGAAEGPRRRAATLVFSDLKGSTALAERLDAETLRTVLTRYFDAMRVVFESHGGSVAKIIGDAIVVVFDPAGDPSAAARRASRAVLESLVALEALNERFDDGWGVRLENRTGVASGSLAAGEVDDAGLDLEVLAGEVVGTAESLESGSPVGAALVDHATRVLLGADATTEPHDPVPRKGGTGTVAAWRLVAVAAGDDGRSVRGKADPSGAGGASRENRRTVTIVFADPKPISSSGAALDADVTHAVMSRYIEVVRPVLERHGGTVEKFIGDAVMAVFGLPVRHEDDAVRAVRAAADVQAALGPLNEELEERFGVRFANPVGVNTGTVVAGDGADGERLVTGDAVNVAARLEQTASPGEVILGDLTYRLTADLAPIEVTVLEPLVLKGKSEPVPAYRLERVSRSGAANRRHDLPLVGRDREMAALRSVLAAAHHGGRAARITVMGDAGVGKSRLTHEFLSEAGRSATVLQGNCLAYGDGITFWPLLRVLHDAAGIAEEDDAATALAKLEHMVGPDREVQQRLGSITGLVATQFSVPEIVWAMRRVVEHLSASRPLVVVFDDVHWAEPTFLEVVDQILVGLSAPLLVLCSARPTAVDDHPDFVGGAASIVLEPMTDEHAGEFLRLLLGTSAVDASTVDRIVSAAAGNPLFLEQLLSMLIDEGRLQDTGHGWRVRGDLATLEVPATIEALLAARLDRLPDAERDTIGPASVIGRHFATDALDHLVGVELRTDLDARLLGLASRDLVAAEDDHESYRFQHQMIRDATYSGLLKQSRAVLHELFVGWAEAKNEDRDRATEFDEILGYHLEQAHRCWKDLGPLDDHAVQLGIAGSNRLARAGSRALSRGDMHAASNLLDRAARLLPARHPDRPAILLGAGNALHENGSFDRAIEVYDASAGAASDLGDRAASLAASIERLRLQYLIGRVDDAEVIADQLQSARQVLGELDDPEPDASSRVWQLQLNVDIAACRWGAAQRAADEVIEHAQQAGNDLLAVRTMPLLAFLAQKGTMPVPEATAVCEGILAVVAGDRRSTSLTQLELALLATMALDVEEGRRLCAATRTALGELGWEMQAALVSLASGPIELLADEPERAEAELRRDYETLDRLGERNFISLTAVLLAEAVYRQRRFEEAADLVAFGRELAAPDDLAVQIIACTVSAKLAARAGTPDALAIVDEAVEMMASTEDPSGLGDVLLDRAEVLGLLGDPGGAVAAATEARERYGAKANLAGIRRAERIAAAVAGGGDPLG